MVLLSPLPVSCGRQSVQQKRAEFIPSLAYRSALSVLYQALDLAQQSHDWGSAQVLGLQNLWHLTGFVL